jgi:hypothetical protein
MTRDVTLPSSDFAYIHFDSAYDFDQYSDGYGNNTYYDGGVLEYSTDGGSTWFDANFGNFWGSPNGWITDEEENPLAGRHAYVGTSEGYISSQAELIDIGRQVDLRGKNIRFRFRIGSGSSIGGDGWFIDNVDIYTCSQSGVAFSASNYSFDESSGDVTVDVNRLGTTSGTATVHVASSDGTATAGSDYDPVSEDVTFAPGESTKPVTIHLNDDSVYQGNRTFKLTLSSPTGAGLGSPSTATVMIEDDENALFLSPSSYSVAENAGAAKVTIARTGSTANELTVHIATSDGTATAGSDYTAVDENVTLGAGVASLDVSIPLLDDQVYEPDETFTVTLSSPTGAVLTAPTTATVTITDNDTATLALSADSYSIAENGGSLGVQVDRSGASGSSFSVHVATLDGTAKAGQDYTAVSQDVTFAPGETSKSVNVPISDDDLYEGPETFTVNLSDPSSGASLGSPSTATVTITDDDTATISFSASSYSVSEGDGSAQIQLKRAGALGSPMSVHLASSNGTASAGSDYTAVSQDVTFAAGETSKTIPIPITRDSQVESDETVNLSLSSPSAGASLGDPHAAVLTILDNTATISLSASSYSVGEGDGSTSIQLTRTGGPVGSFTVHFATSDGTASAGSDYTAVSQDVTFAVGETSKTISIPITNDSLPESDETVALSLSSPSAGATLGSPSTATLTIVDDDMTAITFSKESYWAWEAEGSVPIQVERLGSVANTVAVALDTSDGTATADSDYTAVHQTVAFAPGETSKTVNVPITDLELYEEGYRTFKVALSNPSLGCLLGSTDEATVEIFEDDTAAFQLATGQYSAVEGEVSASIQVDRWGADAGSFSVHLATSDGTAKAGSDYTAVDTTVSFAKNESSKTVNIPLIDDNEHERNETVNITLSSPSTGARLIYPSTAVLTIEDDDAASSAARTGSEATGKLSFAKLSKKSFMAAQAKKVKLTVKFSPKSKIFKWVVSLKQGKKWKTVKSVKKTGFSKTKYTTTVKKLFAGKKVKIGRYRLKLYSDRNSKTLAFRVK